MAAVPQKTIKEIERMRAAQGVLHVLCVGVSEQLRKSGYRAIPQCKEDAKSVYDMFREKIQLNAHHSHTHLLLNPSRGLLASKIDDLVVNAGDKDRILFFFSGHGERIEDKLYLVPQDAWSCENPDALYDYEELKFKISSSRAKQKIIIMDACYSGSDTTTIKKAKNLVSKGFLERTLKGTSGTLTISSSSETETSTTKSPSKDHSLFTYFLLKALMGHEDALDDHGMLTSSTLHKYLYVNVVSYSRSYGNVQTPIKTEAIAGLNIVLGDFSKIISTTSHSLTDVSSTVTFTEEEAVRSAELLPSREKVDFSDFDNYRQIIEYHLPNMYKKEVGKIRATIRNVLALDWEDTEIEGTSIYFKDGGFSISYVEIDSKKGVIETQISFNREWFSAPGAILTTLETLKFNPSKITRCI